MLVVISLGDNALLRRRESPEAETPRATARRAAATLAEIAAEHRVVIMHGSSPSTALLALQSEAVRDVRTYPLDVLGTESEGMIGYMIEQELRNALPGRSVVSLVAEVAVDVMDPAFRTPTEPVGPVYCEDEARSLAATRGWQIAPAGTGWRRVVASPTPRSLPDLPAMQILLEADAVVVCTGGGIPVVIDSRGAHHSVEAVVDKDRASALLGRGLRADALLLLTDVPAVEAGWGTPDAHPVSSADVDDLRALELEPGSMGSKVAAACWFAATTGGASGVGLLEDAPEILAGKAGTTITASHHAYA